VPGNDRAVVGAIGKIDPNDKARLPQPDTGFAPTRVDRGGPVEKGLDMGETRFGRIELRKPRDTRVIWRESRTGAVTECRKMVGILGGEPNPAP